MVPLLSKNVRLYVSFSPHTTVSLCEYNASSRAVLVLAYAELSAKKYTHKMTVRRKERKETRESTVQ